MRLHKLFNVLVLGGSSIVAGAVACDPTPGRTPDNLDGSAQVETGAPVDGHVDPASHADAFSADSRRADAIVHDGVPAWMSWFTEPDSATSADTAPAVDSSSTDDATRAADASAATDASEPATDADRRDGVPAWLSWA